ncbi:tetratricopeptide repeat protein [Archangium lansingense]|uniref:Tetratricopeptide repeat protein n=1 Tax=Archangium lansingense TaxID=2995310 RepID=A0ABT3ZXD0_9BACT|nr:hypothetical protein [Archangium lansinium]MCY1074053.1 hypothetical protein [Archangium lansinium]
MPNDENALPKPVEPIPLVQEVVAQNAVIAGSVDQLTLNINGTGINVQEFLRVVLSREQRSGAPADDDPFASEIDANVGLIDRHLFSEALDGFRKLQQKCGTKQGLSRSRFRIANNTGVCLMGLERYSEARAEFNKALSIEPDSDLVRVNLAAANLHADEPSLTLDLLDKPITNVSMRGQGGALRVAALSKLGRYDDIERFLREEAWAAYDARVQLAVAYAMASKGDADRVDKALRVAVGNEETALNAHILHGMCALGVAARLGNGIDFVPVSKDLPRDRLETALAEFRHALDLCPSGLRDTRAGLLAQCGLVLSLLGELEKALEAFEASRSTSSRPNVLAVVNHAAVLMERNEFSAAARLIRDSGLVDQHPHVRLQLGAALLAAHADADVIELLANAWQNLPAKEKRIRGATLVLDSCRRIQRAELGREICDVLAREYADSWDAWFHLGRYFAGLGDQTQALSSFQKALSLANEEDSCDVREQLGYRQAMWGDYAGCITTLEPLNITTLGDGAAQAFVVSLYNTGALNRARTVVDTLLTREHVPEQVLEVAVAIASQAGDLERATELQRRLLQERKPRLRDINCLATLLLRKGDRQQAVDSLSVDASEMEGGQDAHELMVFAFLLSAVRDKRALTYGYRSWERGRDQAQIQLGYVGLFLNRERGDSDRLESDVIVPGTTATLSVVGRSGSRVVSIVQDGDLIPDAATWVKASDPLATRLIGKRVGDEIAGPSNPLVQTVYRIDKIKSNFVRAFQETMSGFNERFPDAEGLWKFEVPRDDPSELTKLLLSIPGNSGRIKELVAMHTQGRLPLAALAGALHRSVPTTWSGLIHDDSGRVFFSRGAGQEFEVAERIIGERNQPVYLDYSALMTLMLLDAESRTKIAQLISPVRVVQSLLDDLHSHAVQAMPKGTGEGMNVSVGEDGRLRVAPLGDEHGFLMRVQEVARAVALPCAAYSQFNAPPAEREVASKVLGEPTSDLLWEAAATGGMVLCDDQALGMLAQIQNQTPTASIQAVALAAHRKGRMTLPEYSAIVERLAVARYRFITVDEDVIEAILERHQWRPTSEVMAVFSCLEGPDCNTSSAALVGAKVLKAIVLESASAPNRNALVDVLLARLTTGHDVRQVTKRSAIDVVHFFRRRFR